MGRDEIDISTLLKYQFRPSKYWGKKQRLTGLAPIPKTTVTEEVYLNNSLISETIMLPNFNKLKRERVSERGTSKDRGRLRFREIEREDDEDRL